jgi:hypothetical protein
MYLLKKIVNCTWFILLFSGLSVVSVASQAGENPGTGEDGQGPSLTNLADGQGPDWPESDEEQIPGMVALEDGPRADRPESDDEQIPGMVEEGRPQTGGPDGEIRRLGDIGEFANWSDAMSRFTLCAGTISDAIETANPNILDQHGQLSREKFFRYTNPQPVLDQIAESMSPFERQLLYDWIERQFEAIPKMARSWTPSERYAFLNLSMMFHSLRRAEPPAQQTQSPLDYYFCYLIDSFSSYIGLWIDSFLNAIGLF